MSLRALLLPHFTVQPVNPTVLATQPWTTTCALLVVPGGRDIPYLSALQKAIPSINRYIREQGGSYLGFCAGAYFACKSIEWEVGTPLEVKGPRPLGFFPGLSKGCVFPGFQYESDEGARAVSLSIKHPQKRTIYGVYYNGGGEFILPAETTGIKVLATYEDEEAIDKIAAVECQAGKGKATLWFPHLEYPASSPQVNAAALKGGHTPTREEIVTLETERLQLLRETLLSLGLKPGNNSQTPESRPLPTRPLPQILASSPTVPHAVGSILSLISKSSFGSIELPFDDTNDTFHFVPSHAAKQIIEEEYTKDTSLEGTRYIIPYPNGESVDPTLTPLFDTQKYFADLQVCRKKENAKSDVWEIGDVLIYGEAVTSTQTLLERNLKLLDILPTPLLSLATIQLSGRGRGSNQWVSPLGCLQWSLLLRPPSTLPPAKFVFIQYLVGLAVVEACRELLGPVGERVVLKWPNDIYAVTPSENGLGEQKRKIGGILVQAVFGGEGPRLIVGCGLNILNSPPIMSLSQLPGAPALTMEKAAATVMAHMNRFWTKFEAERGSFESFHDLYLERWMHSDQQVTIETTTPPTKVRIAGITLDHGLLRTMPEIYKPGQPQFIDLQPDGNSFDMMAGLIRSKT